MSTNAPSATTAELESALRDVLRDALTLADGTYAVDGLVPRFVATPGSVEELAAALAAADDHGAAVIPWGGGQHMALGNVPGRYDLALRTTKLDRVLEYEPADLTVTVEAGITMGRLQAVLAEHGQFLPIDAPADATVGGVLAAGVSGPSRHAYGLPRDWLLGCRVALADGTVIKGGGRVVKNVAGYDMPKLAIDSLGTLGVIVEATFKVAPLPPVQETLLATFPALEGAAEAIFAADERGLALRAVALQAQPKGSAVLAAFWLAGTTAAVERTARELADLSQGAETRRVTGEESERWWAELAEHKPPAESAVACRTSLPPSAVAGFVARCDGHTIAYPTTGLVVVQLEARAAERVASLVDALRRAACDAGGSLVVTSAPVEVKERIDVWGDPSTSSGQAPSTSSGQAPSTSSGQAPRRGLHRVVRPHPSLQ